MPVGSVAYLLYLALCAFLFYLVRAAWWRKAVVLGMSLSFFFAQSSMFLPLALVAGFVVFAFAATVLASRAGSGIGRGSAITVLLIGFVFAKRYWFVPEIGYLAMFSTIGLSYIIFRAVHLIVETGDGIPLRWRDFTRYLRYQLLPFGLHAGPIHDYQAFVNYEEEIGDVRADRGVIAAAFWRLTVGFLKVVALAPVAYSYFDEARAGSEFLLAAAAVLFIGYIYLNFSGYMDIVIGSAQVFGITLPENFNRPWMATSFVDFWSRWHITLSFFFRDYLFFPLMGACSRISSSRRFLFWGSIVISFFAFFLLGLWHGTEPKFVGLAILLGIGVALDRIWHEGFAKRFFSGAEGAPSPVAGLVGHIRGAAAVFYFGFAAITVWPGMGFDTFFVAMRKLFTSDGLLGVAACLAVLVGIRLLTLGFDSALKKAGGFSPWFREVAIGVNVALLAILFKIVSAAHSPQIYYRDF